MPTDEASSIPTHQEGGSEEEHLRDVGSGVEISLINCGGHTAFNCSAYTQGKDAGWCNGACKWCDGECVLATEDVSSDEQDVVMPLPG